MRVFLDSARELKRVRGLVVAAMLLALQVVLGLVAAIPVGPSIRISFGYLALSAAGALLGPAVAPINGALADVIVFLIRPTGPYFPGFTVTGLVSGFIYGLMLYRRDVTLRRLLVTKLLIDLICNLLLNTIWIHMLYGKALFALLPSRALKNLIQYPVDVLLMYPVMKKVIPMVRRQMPYSV
ncbi:MAG: folate family ECF transporter S component [Clostridia bacterium]|nr:folate family ECF transporter S component [Clostridia bacterium]